MHRGFSHFNGEAVAHVSLPEPGDFVYSERKSTKAIEQMEEKMVCISPDAPLPVPSFVLSN